jgi:hypothetical protein
MNQLLNEISDLEKCFLPLLVTLFRLKILSLENVAERRWSEGREVCGGKANKRTYEYAFRLFPLPHLQFLSARLVAKAKLVNIATIL